jgi:hypothetical protein
MRHVCCLQAGAAGAVAEDASRHRTATLFKKLVVGTMFVLLNVEVTSNCRLRYVRLNLMRLAAFVFI